VAATVEGQEMSASSLKRARGESIGGVGVSTKKGKVSEQSHTIDVQELKDALLKHHALAMLSKNYYRGKCLLESPYLFA
jgi:hypothetical protein